MRYLVSGKEMKLLDINTSEHFGVPELVLMEQAAMTFVWKFFKLQQTYKKNCNRILIVCGSGNNGADGLAVARLLYQKGKNVTVYPVGEIEGHRTSNSYDTQKEIDEAYGIRMVMELPDENFDVIIDAIFGIGLSRDITGTLADCIQKLNERSSWKLAYRYASFQEDLSFNFWIQSANVPVISLDRPMPKIASIITSKFSSGSSMTIRIPYASIDFFLRIVGIAGTGAPLFRPPDKRSHFCLFDKEDVPLQDHRRHYFHFHIQSKYDCSFFYTFVEV